MKPKNIFSKKNPSILEKETHTAGYWRYVNQASRIRRTLIKLA